MKETSKMSRAICQLEKMFNVINTELFNSELPKAIITVQSTKGRSYGHSTTRKIWYNKNHEEMTSYEINISAEFLNEEIECTLDTLIHEMIHLYCRIKDIKETSRGNCYHNKTFKKLAEERGLKCYYDNRIGYNTDHRNNEKLTEYAINHNWYDIEIGTKAPTFNFSDFAGIFGNGTNTEQQPEQTETQGTKSSTIKYKCPKCNTKIRATKDLDGMIMCKKCNCDYIRF